MSALLAVVVSLLTNLVTSSATGPVVVGFVIFVLALLVWDVFHASKGKSDEDDTTSLSSYVDRLIRDYSHWARNYVALNLVRVPTARVSAPGESAGSTLPPAEELMRHALFTDDTPGERRHDDTPVEALTCLIRRGSRRTLLVGGPGAGKTTVLERVLYEQVGLHQAKRGQPIPVLLRLRHLETSAWDLLRDTLHSQGLPLSSEDLRERLERDKFLLLLDGLNELPSASARTSLQNFLLTFDVPVIATTRDLTDQNLLPDADVYALLDFDRAAATTFTRARLGAAENDAFWNAATTTVDALSRIPLFLSMLCVIYRDRKEVPAQLSTTLRSFGSVYELQMKADLHIADPVRQWWSQALAALAHAMTWNGGSLDGRLTIQLDDAEEVVRGYLSGRAPAPDALAIQCIGALHKHHLLTKNGSELQFPHQVIQDYYAAEHLLRSLSDLNDDLLCADYLNLVKWSETLLFMAGIADDETTLRLATLAFDRVDPMLAARIAAVSGDATRRRVVELISAIPVEPDTQEFLNDGDGGVLWLSDGAYKGKLTLLVATRSSDAIPFILEAADARNLRSMF
ncbi:NACHT domain-containing protein [Asanoa iriomotensis]|uniref:NACHT domain-containing protein n=1 Tax=Asanoa iriomotensis TaxID=234613 RepID=A0ABQ4BZU6_9ACTN|nr:NACHT domain-containing protein [Asanoa iriomotensis]GIF56059.1 hypothetical protein Air01nite_21540 [Asanoa iriomotensis]